MQPIFLIGNGFNFLIADILKNKYSNENLFENFGDEFKNILEECNIIF